MSSNPNTLTPPQAMDRAIAALHAGRIQEAAGLCQSILAANPGHFDALNLLGVLHLRGRDLAAALDCFTRATQLHPGLPEPFNNRGVVLQQLRRWEEALQSFQKALAISPDFIDALFNRAVVLSELKRWDDALAAYKRVLALQPGHAGAWNNAGNVLRELRQWDDALRHYQRALELRPDYAEALNNRGVVQKELKRWEEALRSYDRALEIRPDHAEALQNRGVVLRELKRWDEAMESFGRALALRPDYAEAFINRGLVLQELRRWDEAMESFDRALALQPEHAEAHWNKALLLLMLGDFERGWPLYEWRWRTEAVAPQARAIPKPLWLGREDLEGKSILLHAEQGLGDSIQFSRYAPLVAALGAHVVLESPASLVRLLSSSFAGVEVISKGSVLPEVDFHCPLASLPLAFGTTLASIPARVPYLAAAPALVGQWRERLGEAGRMQVGLAWAGNPAHRKDHDRSLALSRLKPLLELDMDFHCLHSEVREADRDAASGCPAMKFWCEHLHDFADTAALVASLDLVISVDTSVAHLAAAMGKPTWILVTYSPDYRWLLERTDSPWYPTARLFRQPRVSDWDTVLETVAIELGGLRRAGLRLPAG